MFGHVWKGIAKKFIGGIFEGLVKYCNIHWKTPPYEGRLLFYWFLKFYWAFKNPTTRTLISLASSRCCTRSAFTRDRTARTEKFEIHILANQDQFLVLHQILKGEMYRVVQKKVTVLLSTSLAWPAVAGCSRAETFSQLSSISFSQPCR